MKLLLVKMLGKFSDEEHVEVISEANDIYRLKEIGSEVARQRRVKSIQWSDWSPPTMGDDKLKDPSKLLLKVSENEFLVIRK